MENVRFAEYLSVFVEVCRLGSFSSVVRSAPDRRFRGLSPADNLDQRNQVGRIERMGDDAAFRMGRGVIMPRRSMIIWLACRYRGLVLQAHQQGRIQVDGTPGVARAQGEVIRIAGPRSMLSDPRF
jgi:hypothetical protein